MRLVLAMVLAGLGTLPLSVSAQAEGPEEAPEQAAEQGPAPSSEPAPEEPALQLKLDDAGVEVAPSYRAFKEMDRRVKRARIGLGVSIVAMTVVGPPLIVAGTAASLSSCEWGGAEDCSPPEVPGLIAAGAFVTAGGLAGTIASGILLRRRKRERDSLWQAHYGTPRRVQWDVARSRLVF